MTNEPTTEQLRELLAICESAVFEDDYRPHFPRTTCAALVREVLRLRETQETYDQFVIDGHIVDEERLAELRDFDHGQS